MKIDWFLHVLFVMCMLPLHAHAREQAVEPYRLLDEAVQAMGGERLAAIRAVGFRANLSRNMLEQSIRPEGPWIMDMQTMDLVLDFEDGRVSKTTTRRGRLASIGDPDEVSPPVQRITADGVAATRVGDDAFSPGSRSQLQNAAEWLAFNPLRVLTTAASADDLHFAGNAVRHGVAQRVVAWSHAGTKVRLYLGAATHLPSAVEWVAPRPADMYWGAWGDVRTKLTFENWTLQKDGLRVPTQWNMRRNDLPDRTIQIYAMDLNPVLDEADWHVDEALRAKFAEAPGSIEAIAFGRPDRSPIELPGGVVVVPGRWYVAFVRQSDGVVVIEAPISSGYSAQALEAAERLFPGVRVKAVVSTSDAWPHIGGLREYAARGIPIYLLDLNRPIVERLLASSHDLRPDALARAPRQALLREVSTPLSLGEGDHRIELVPLRTTTGERQMLIVLPGGALYTSDLVQPQRAGQWYSPETRLELRQRLQSLGLAAETCFGMHYSPVPCASLLERIPGALASGDAPRY